MGGRRELSHLCGYTAHRVRVDELGVASSGMESRGYAGWLLRHQLEIPPLRGRFGWQKKWIKNSGWGISYLLMPSLRTVLHCSSRKSLFDTFIYWLVLLKGKANEASDKDILDTTVEMPSSLGRKPVQFHVTPALRIFCLWILRAINLVGKCTFTPLSTASYGVHTY